jgi:hypothetical protein
MLEEGGGPVVVEAAVMAATLGSSRETLFRSGVAKVMVT